MGIRHRAIVAMLAAALVGGRVAEANQFRLFVAQDSTFDDNVFRLPPGATPSAQATGVARPPLGEMRFTTSAGLGFDTVYRRQRPRAEFTLTRYAHQTYKYLDFTGISGRAGWHSSIGDRWTGTMGYERTQAPSNDATQTGFRTANRLDERIAGEAEYRVYSRWSVGGSLNKVGSRYNNTVSRFSDYDAKQAAAHVAYRSRRGNQFRVLARGTDGGYSSRSVSHEGIPAQSYVQLDYEADITWVPTGHSRVGARLGFSRFDYGALAPAFRNFEGVTGRVAYDWTPTEQSTIGVVVRREIGPELLYYANATVVGTTAASVTATSALSPKIGLRAAAELRRQMLAGQAGALDGPLRSPDYAQLTVTGTWTPKHYLLFSMAVGHERRRGPSPHSPDFNANTVSAHLQWSFL